MSESSGVAATALFVEILVVGSGVAIACTLAAFKVSPELSVRIFDGGFSVILAVAMTPIIYLMGIIVDRASDKILHPYKKRLKRRYFSSDNAYDEARSWVNSDPQYSELSGYARSRMRVCRGWVINSLLITAASGSIYLSSSDEHYGDFFLAMAIFFLTLAIASLLSWRNIVTIGYRKTASQYAFHKLNRSV